MSDENNCNHDYKRFKKNFGNNTSNIGNKYISNELPSSDLRNKINFKRSQRRNNFDSDWNKPRNDNIVIECQSGECDELEWRNRKVKIQKKQVFSSNDIELYKEYEQWDFINNKLWMQIGTFVNIVNNECKQRITNIIKNWIILINEDFSELLKYEYYKILPKVDLRHPATRFLRRELIENQFVNEEDADEKIKKILDFISTNHSKVIPKNLADPLRVEFDSNRNVLIVNKFKYEKVSHCKSLSNENEIICAARVLLREKCLDNANYRFSDQKEVRNEGECESGERKDKLEWRNGKSRKENWEKESDCIKQRNDRIVDEWESRERKDIAENWQNRKQFNKEKSKEKLGDQGEGQKESEWRDGRIRVIVGIRSPEGIREMREIELKGFKKQPNKEENSNNRLSNQKEVQNESEWRNRGNRIERRLEEGRERSDVLEWKHNRKQPNKEENSNNRLGDKRAGCIEREWRRDKNEVSKENSRVVLKGDSIELYKEYVQWDFINNKLYNKGESLLSIRTNREKQEFTNTLQRWFIFINEDFNEVPKYENYTILPNIRLGHPAAQFLREAIIEKKFATEEDADEKMRKILSFISRSHSEVVPHDPADPLHVEHDGDRKIVVVNKFQSEEVPRVNLLVKKGGVFATARMLLRYESFGNGSYQWGDPQEVHKVLHEKFNVRYEGFASPVNSRFIEYEDAHFCSLFSETDAPFGSIGNFFHVDMKQHCGGWSVNPPFLNDLMKNVAIRINSVLDEGHECYFFCTFPCWEDDEGWNILDKSKHLLKRFNLPPHHFIVQDAYGNKFEPKMAMNLFVMGELPSTVSRLTELGNILIHNPKNIFPESCPW